MHVLALLTIYIIYFEQKLPKTKCYNVVCNRHIHLLTNNMLFVTNNANCSSHTHHIKELFCSPKEKDLTLPLNLTLMTVIIYTGNKVKSNRGEEKKKGFN